MAENPLDLKKLLPKELQLQMEFDELVKFFQNPPPEFANRFSDQVIFVRSRAGNDQVSGKMGFDPKNPGPIATYWSRVSDFVRIDPSSFINPETETSLVGTFAIPEIVEAFSEGRGLIVIPVPKDSETDFFVPNKISGKPHYYGPVESMARIPCYLLNPSSPIDVKLNMIDKYKGLRDETDGF